MGKRSSSGAVLWVFLLSIAFFQVPEASWAEKGESIPTFGSGGKKVGANQGVTTPAQPAPGASTGNPESAKEGDTAGQEGSISFSEIFSSPIGSPWTPGSSPGSGGSIFDLVSRAVDWISNFLKCLLQGSSQKVSEVPGEKSSPENGSQKGGSSDPGKGTTGGKETAEGKGSPVQSYTVCSGDTLWDIANRYLGSGERFNEIVKANQTRYPSLLKNPHLIEPGWVLTLPTGSKDSGTKSTSGTTVSNTQSGSKPNPPQDSGNGSKKPVENNAPETSTSANVSEKGKAQMKAVVEYGKAHHEGGSNGFCYRAVWGYLTGSGYGKLNSWWDLPDMPSGEARNFAEYMNSSQSHLDQAGLQRLDTTLVPPITNPHDPRIPVGAVVVVAAGSYGTSHATAGDIVIKAGESHFINDGPNMDYGTRDSWYGYLLGVYIPK